MDVRDKVGYALSSPNAGAYEEIFLRLMIYAALVRFVVWGA